MSIVPSITISGHVESTVYHRGGREWISLDGKEIGVYEYRPGTSQIGLKVVQLHELYHTVQAVPTIGVYSGTDIMERISHDISVFWTKLSSVIDAVKNTPEIDVNALLELSDMVIELAHTCGSEIEKEQSKSREALLEAESSKYDATQLNQELIASTSMVSVLKKKSHSYSKALKCALTSSEDSPPLLHQLCQEKDVSVTEIIQEFGLKYSQQAVVPNLAKRLRLEPDLEFLPIHIASICGNASVVKELYDLDPTKLLFPIGGQNLHVLPFSTFGSLECFELAKSLYKVESPDGHAKMMLATGNEILRLAALGGNSIIFSSLLPHPQSFSAIMYRTFWQELIVCACIAGNLDNLKRLMQFENSEASFTEDLCRKALSNVDPSTVSLECIQWIIERGQHSKERLQPDLSFRMAQAGRLDIIKWLRSFAYSPFSQQNKKGDTLMHMACQSNSASILAWALERTSRHDFNILNAASDHIVHVAARYGSLDCLKWICENIKEFKHVSGSRHLLSITGYEKQTVLHYAVKSGSIPTLNWLHAEHGADFSSLDSVDAKGCIPFHNSIFDLNILEWMLGTGNCQLEARNVKGLQILHVAILNDLVEVVEFIVSEIGVNCLNEPIPNCGRTAAHFVKTEMMGECLLQYGANLSIPRRNGLTLSRQRPKLKAWLQYRGFK